MSSVKNFDEKYNYNIDLSKPNVSLTKKQIDWQTLPVKIETGFLETRLARRIAASSLTGFAGLSAISTIGTAVWFTAPPLTVIAATTGLALLTLASIVAAIALLCLKQSANDPHCLLANRMKLKQELEDNSGLSFENIRKRYSEKIISDGEISILLIEDLERLDYHSFIKKHGEKAVNAINQENRPFLRSKCLDFFKCHLNFNEIANRFETTLLDIKEEEWASEVASREARRIYLENGSYEDFIKSNGNRATAFLDQSHPAFLHFKNSFETSILQQNMGVLKYKEIYAADDSNLKMNLQDRIIALDLEKIQKGLLSYADFFERNGMGAIEECIKDPVNLQILRSAYLNSPYAEKRNLNQHELLQITPTEISQLLLQKWAQRNILEIVQDPDFKDSIGIIIQPEEFSQKALEQTASMQIIEVARLMPILFSSKIIKYDQTSFPFNIRSRLHNELAALSCIEDLVNLPSVLFACDMIDRSHHKIVQLVKGFVISHASAYLESNWTANERKIRHLIDSYQLMPSRIAKKINKAQSGYALSKAEYQKLLKEYSNDYGIKLSNLKNSRDQQKSANVSQLEISKLEMKITNCRSKLQEAAANLAEAMKIQTETKAKQEKINQNISKHTGNINALSSKIMNLEHTRPEQNLNYANGLLLTTNNRIKALQAGINSNPQLLQLDSKIVSLEGTVNELIRSHNQLVKTLNDEEAAFKAFEAKANRLRELRKEVNGTAFALKVKELGIRIQAAESARKRPTGLVNAFKALQRDAALEADKQSLKELRAKRDELENIRINFKPEQERVARETKINQLKSQLAQSKVSIRNDQDRLFEYKKQRQNLIVSSESSGLVQLKAQKQNLEESLHTNQVKALELQNLRAKLNKEKESLAAQNEEFSKTIVENNISCDLVGKFSANKANLHNKLKRKKMRLGESRRLIQNKNNQIDAQFAANKDALDQQHNLLISQTNLQHRSNLADMQIAFQNDLANS